MAEPVGGSNRPQAASPDLDAPRHDRELIHALLVRTGLVKSASVSDGDAPSSFRVEHVRSLEADVGHVRLGVDIVRANGELEQIELDVRVVPEASSEGEACLDVCAHRPQQDVPGGPSPTPHQVRLHPVLLQHPSLAPAPPADEGHGVALDVMLGAAFAANRHRGFPGLGARVGLWHAFNEVYAMGVGLGGETGHLRKALRVDVNAGRRMRGTASTGITLGLTLGLQKTIPSQPERLEEPRYPLEVSGGVEMRMSRRVTGQPVAPLGSLVLGGIVPVPGDRTEDIVPRLRLDLMFGLRFD